MNFEVGAKGGAVTTLMVVRPDDAPIDIDSRLRVWRERWHHAPTTDARAHAQVAIDYWLDRLLETELLRTDHEVPAQRAGVTPVVGDATGRRVSAG